MMMMIISKQMLLSNVVNVVNVVSVVNILNAKNVNVAPTFSISEYQHQQRVVNAPF